ncbi:hypothetical protein MIZ03_3041 [Rhodoferax lithotrophicus]|uniref:Uncharacterized protein n=1 Tax=Rhodoferax lithotrophicus TaxID=2798804 RepID=A0ABN6DB23_9BURK|nr:hypothetical protein MIZ03_3041 [Rhodoferax sp. MIZ03]
MIFDRHGKNAADCCIGFSTGGPINISCVRFDNDFTGDHWVITGGVSS